MIRTDDVKAALFDTIKDDMEVETEPNVREQYKEYFKQVEWKQSDNIFAEVEDENNVDIISMFIYYGVKIMKLLVIMRSCLRTLVILRLTRTGVSL